MMWMGENHVVMTTPLPNQNEFMQGFLAAIGDPDLAAQKALKEELSFGYCSGMGKAIFVMIAIQRDAVCPVT